MENLENEPAPPNSDGEDSGDSDDEMEDMNPEHHYPVAVREEEADLPYLLRSMVNNHQSFYRFINRTHRPVDLIWINFRGTLQHVRTLKTGEFVDVNTFRSHIWVAVDSILKQRMNIENKSLFICPDVPRVAGERITRDILHIILPLRTLKLTAMLSLFEQDMLKSLDDVDRLCLPFSLKEHLREALRRIQTLQTGSLISYTDN